VSVVSGETARDKTVRIEALADPAAALEILTAAG
jgi:uncharacterized protein YggU (UPF0235/DUF167 family)